jgi:hypothetical protein
MLAARPCRTPRDPARERRDDRRERWRDNDPPAKPGEWNGPIPEFLGISALP